MPSSGFGWHIDYKSSICGGIMFAWLMNFISKIFGNTATTNMKQRDENWIGPDDTESGPGVAENWYLSYDGPAPIVEDIYDENYGVDRGNGAVPIEFYIKKWGIPDGFGKTDFEKNIADK